MESVCYDVQENILSLHGEYGVGVRDVVVPELIPGERLTQS